MKRVSALICMLVLLFAAAGCGGASGAAEVDLTTLNGLNPTLLYSLAVNIAEKPADYNGKTVCAEGDLTLSENPQYITIFDATGCCMQSLEVRLGDLKNLPEDGATVRVSGTFRTETNSAGTLIYIEASGLEPVEEY